MHREEKRYSLGSAVLDLTVELILEAPCKHTCVKPLRLPLDASSNEMVWLGPMKSVMCRAGGQEVRGALGRDGEMQPRLRASGGDLWGGNSRGGHHHGWYGYSIPVWTVRKHYR